MLLAYEADAKTSLAAGQQIQVIEPQQNILIQNPSAVTTTGLNNPAAVAFYAYLYSTDGQTVWVHNWFRSTPGLVPGCSKGRVLPAEEA